MSATSIEKLNIKAEQVAFIGRAMERENKVSLSEYLMEAALLKAESTLGTTAPASKKQAV